MFSKAKKTGGDAVMSEADMPSLPSPAAAKKPAPKPKAAKGAGVPSIISDDVVIRGAIESEGEVQFDGAIEGDIKAASLVIGEGAKVDGEVVADQVRVCGTVEGAIRATRVELAAGALVRGDIIHTALAIEAGARFEGNVQHSDDPAHAPSLSRKAKAAPGAKPAELVSDFSAVAPGADGPRPVKAKAG